MAVERERRARVEELLAAARVLADPRAAESLALRQRLEQTTGLSRPSIDFALERCLEQRVSERDLGSLMARTPEAERALVLLSANVFVAPLRAIAIARAASARVVVRPSRREPTLAEALAQMLPHAFQLAPELAPAAGDHYWAYGTDETLTRVRAELPEGVVFHAHGFGLGAVVLDAREALGDLTALSRAIAIDASLFDQRGCLSPRLICVLGDEEHARRLAEAVAGELARLLRALPLGAETREQQAERRRFTDAATFAFEVTRAGHSFVSLALDGRLSLPPIGRNLHIAKVADPAGALAPFGPHLTCLAVRGPAALKQQLHAAYPGARLCEPGQMQTPALDGPVDLRAYR